MTPCASCDQAKGRTFEYSTSDRSDSRSSRIAITKVRPIGVKLCSDAHERTPKLDRTWDLNHVVVICSFTNTVDSTTSSVEPTVLGISSEVSDSRALP